MPASADTESIETTGVNKPSEDFVAFCEAEFERRLNSGESFDEGAYRKAMGMVLERLERLENEVQK